LERKGSVPKGNYFMGGERTLVFSRGLNARVEERGNWKEQKGTRVISRRRRTVCRGASERTGGEGGGSKLQRAQSRVRKSIRSTKNPFKTTSWKM